MDASSLFLQMVLEMMMLQNVVMMTIMMTTTLQLLLLPLCYCCHFRLIVVYIVAVYSDVAVAVAVAGGGGRGIVSRCLGASDRSCRHSRCRCLRRCCWQRMRLPPRGVVRFLDWHVLKPEFWHFAHPE